jgi:hypothetical protein
VRDDERCGDPVGSERYVFCQRLDIVVADGRRTGFAFEQGIDNLLAVEDAARDTELLELVGEERDKGGSIALAIGVEETLFERVEIVLKLRVGHAVRSNCYTNGGAEGFSKGVPGTNF